VTNPTTGFDTNMLTLENRSVYVNEVGSAMISNWHKFVPDAKSIVFVVDVTNLVQLANSLVEFLTVMRGDLDTEDANKPVLLVFNKTDSAAQLDKAHLEAMFCVEELMQDYATFNFVYVSALKNQNCSSINEWITQALRG